MYKSLKIGSDAYESSKSFALFTVEFSHVEKGRFNIDEKTIKEQLLMKGKSFINGNMTEDFENHANTKFVTSLETIGKDF